ncbi:hypothetical protein PN36_30020, partial [Candidatus Thiomargarita nelsonii]
VGSMPPSLRINARNRGIRSPRFILGVGSPKLKFGLLNTLTKVALYCRVGRGNPYKKIIATKKSYFLKK